MVARPKQCAKLVLDTATRLAYGWRMETTDTQLAALTKLLIHGDKPVVVDTGDGIFIVADVTEEAHEIIITLGEMP